jgi:hypothetical protein
MNDFGLMTLAYDVRFLANHASDTASPSPESDERLSQVFEELSQVSIISVSLDKPERLSDDCGPSGRQPGRVSRPRHSRAGLPSSSSQETSIRFDQARHLLQFRSSWPNQPSAQARHGKRSQIDQPRRLKLLCCFPTAISLTPLRSTRPLSTRGQVDPQKTSRSPFVEHFTLIWAEKPEGYEEGVHPLYAAAEKGAVECVSLTPF